MANVKITELTAATALASTDVLPIVDVGADATKKVSVSDLLRNLPDGSAASPSLAFADDQNSGILSPAENELAFATSGTQRLRIDSNGELISVRGSFLRDVNTGELVLAGGNATNAGANIKLFGGAHASTPNILVFRRGSSESMRIDSSGRVGIGVSSPSSKLDVDGEIRTDDDARFTSGARHKFVGGGSGNNLELGTYSSSNTSRDVHLVIDSAGRVGIGTSSPSQLLHLQSSDPSVQITRTGSHVARISAPAGGGLSIGADGSDGSTVRFRINNSGNVGIGTTSPANTLELSKEANHGITLTRPTGGSNPGTCKIDVNSHGKMLLQADADIEIKPDANNNVIFSRQTASEVARIDSSGRLLVGHSSSRSSANALEPRFQMEGINVSTSTAAIVRNENGTNGPILALSKSRGTSTGSSTIVQNGDITGAIHFAGADGTDLNSFTAWIQSEVDGTPGSNDMPGRLTFYTTADGANSPTERMRIDSAGMVKIGTGSTVTPDGNADDFVIDKGAADTGLSILSTTTGRIYFGDAADHEAGSIRYVHSDNSMRFETSSSERMRIDSSGRLLVGLTSVAAAHTGKIVSRNDVDYTSTEFEDNATLLLQNEYNNNSAVLVFHSNDSGGSSGRAAIVGGTVANGKGKLGFYGSCINKDSSDGEDVTIDADGRLLVGTSSAPNGSHQDTNSTFETYKSSGHNMLRVQSDSLANGQYSMLRAHGNTSGGGSRQVFLGVYKHAAIVNPGPFMLLEAEDGADNYYWTDNSNKLRSSTNNSHIGTTSGSLVGTQTSDLRLKNVGANVSYGLAEVKQLQPKQYALKDDPDVNKLGFIAQEVESIIPEAVFDTLEELDGHQEGDRTKLGMEYVQLIPVLVNAIKELSTEVDTLKTKVAALEAQ